jgi:hypothetical protein
MLIKVFSCRRQAGRSLKRMLGELESNSKLSDHLSHFTRHCFSNGFRAPSVADDSRRVGDRIPGWIYRPPFQLVKSPRGSVGSDRRQALFLRRLLEVDERWKNILVNVAAVPLRQK